MSQPRRTRRPSFLRPATLEALGEQTDPVAQRQAAYETAAVLVHTGRAAHDPEITERLISLTDDIGLSVLTDLWSQTPARSLPGALWRLYLLREWVVSHPHEAAREYGAGVRFTEPHHVVAGVDPPGPDEVRQTADAILRGVFAGDFGVALERAAAFCHVVSSGRADVTHGHRAAVQAGRLQTMAVDLTACARLWRSGELE